MYTWWFRCKYIIIVNQTEAKNMKAQYLNQKRETDRENEQREHMETVGVKPSQYCQWKPDSSMLGMALNWSQRLHYQKPRLDRSIELYRWTVSLSYEMSSKSLFQLIRVNYSPDSTKSWQTLEPHLPVSIICRWTPALGAKSYQIKYPRNLQNAVKHISS